MSKPEKSFKYYEVRHATNICGTTRTEYAYLKAYTQDGVKRQAKRSGIKEVTKITRISRSAYEDAKAGKTTPFYKSAPKPVVRPTPPPPPARSFRDFNGC